MMFWLMGVYGELFQLCELKLNKMACEKSEAGQKLLKPAVAGGQTRLISHPNFTQKQSLRKESFSKV